ncbi:cytochrome P450 [Cladochytrium replicatum]|nr:cytochrome P450 [Cladochytrium replicatum]
MAILPLSLAPLLGSLLITLITFVAIALYFDHTEPKTESTNEEDGSKRKLNLPPKVPLTFILRCLASGAGMGEVSRAVEEKYGDLVRIHTPFRGTLFFVLSNEGVKWAHNAPIADLSELAAFLRKWVADFGLILHPVKSTKLIARSLSAHFYEHTSLALLDLLQDRLRDWCESGEYRDVWDVASDIIFDVNLKVIYGTGEWSREEAAEFKKHFMMLEPGQWILNPLHILFPSIGKAKRDASNPILVSMLRDTALKRLERGLKPNEATLDFYLEQLDGNVVEATFMAHSTMGASVMTTSATCGWLLYHLAVDETVKERVLEEMTKAVGDGPFRLEHTVLMPFMDSMIREIIRCHHGGGAFRTAMRDVQYKGFDIPKGEMVVASHDAMHLSPEIYPNPTAFIPDRFVKDGAASYDRFVKDCQLLTFGGGRHPCLGMKLASTELKILSYLLLTRYNITLEAKQRPALFPTVGFQKPTNPVRIKLSKK